LELHDPKLRQKIRYGFRPHKLRKEGTLSGAADKKYFSGLRLNATYLAIARQSSFAHKPLARFSTAAVALFLLLFFT